MKSFGNSGALAVVLSFSFSFAAFAADDYKLGPDSMPADGIPHGKVTSSKMVSKIFPGAIHDYWVYVPDQYQADKPASLMVFQDGGGFANAKGEFRVPVVFDNLIHKKEMPVTIAVMVNPGVLPAGRTNAHPRYNRSFEYDAVSDQYASFLVDELLPEVSKSYNISKEAKDRAICGSSSGGICAFVAAWHRPDQFQKVLSFVGSFVNLRGGQNLSSLIRKSEPKPLRVFLQDGTNDQDIYGGSWFIGNEDMAAALNFAGYDSKFVVGDGGHNGRHGSSIFPDALRWLWREESPKAAPTKQPVMEVLIPGENWEVVGEGYKFTEGPAADAEGNVYFSDIPNNRIHKIGLDGQVTVFAENTGGANGLRFGPDKLLYACQSDKKRIAAYDAHGQEKVVAEGLESNDLAITRQGNIYVTDPNKKQVWLIQPGGEKKVVATGLGFPNGVVLTPDQTLLNVADTRGVVVWSYHIEADGSLTQKEPYFPLYIPDGRTDSGADGMTVDRDGRLYVTSSGGLQVCDQAGRVIGIISKPQNKWLANVVFGGRNMDTLFVTCTDKVYRRKTKAKGVLSFQDPILPPSPRL